MNPGKPTTSGGAKRPSSRTRNRARGNAARKEQPTQQAEGPLLGARIIRGGLDSDTSGVWKVAGVGLRWT